MALIGVSGADQSSGQTNYQKNWGKFLVGGQSDRYGSQSGVLRDYVNQYGVAGRPANFDFASAAEVGQGRQVQAAFTESLNPVDYTNLRRSSYANLQSQMRNALIPGFQEQARYQSGYGSDANRAVSDAVGENFLQLEMGLTGLESQSAEAAQERRFNAPQYIEQLMFSADPAIARQRQHFYWQFGPQWLQILMGSIPQAGQSQGSSSAFNAGLQNAVETGAQAGIQGGLAAAGS